MVENVACSGFIYWYDESPELMKKWSSHAEFSFLELLSLI